MVCCKHGMPGASRLHMLADLVGVQCPGGGGVAVRSTWDPGRTQTPYASRCVWRAGFRG